MKIIITWLVSILLAAVDSSLMEATPSSGLTIRVLDLMPARGQVVLALFDSPETYKERAEPLRSWTQPVEKEILEWRLDDLAAGAYAVIVFQDLNGNGKLDRGRLGIPKEPYGFSNDARAALGPPSFDQARFSYEGGNSTVEVRLKQKRKPGAMGRVSG